MTGSDLLTPDPVTTAPASAAAEEPPRSFESHRYGVRTEWRDGLEVTLSAPGKPTLDVALSTEFRDGVPGVWCPEELLVAALATCFELTLRSVAGSRGVSLRAVRVDATGHVERRRQLYRIVLVELDVHVEAEEGRVSEIEQIAALANGACLVGNALDVPVRLGLTTNGARSGFRSRHPDPEEGS